MVVERLGWVEISLIKSSKLQISQKSLNKLKSAKNQKLNIGVGTVTDGSCSGSGAASRKKQSRSGAVAVRVVVAVGPCRVNKNVAISRGGGSVVGHRLGLWQWFATLELFGIFVQDVLFLCSRDFLVHFVVPLAVEVMLLALY